MLPIDLPPETPQEALRMEQYRPAVICLWTESERSERPHGGEPDVRVIRILPATSTSETQIFLVHGTLLGSASNWIIEGIKLDRTPVIRIPPADYGRS